MPYTKILPADPQPEIEGANSPSAALPVMLTSGEWIAPDEMLDTGEHVAVSCVVLARDYGAQSVTLLTSARLLTEDGGTVTDQGQDPAHIHTQWRHTASLPQIDRANVASVLISMPGWMPCDGTACWPCLANRRRRLSTTCRCCCCRRSCCSR